MIGKVISGGSFGGTVGYVMKEQSRVLEARGVEPPGVREMVEDFEDQARLNPRLKQNVGHISLSFSPEDAPKLTDEQMTQIAREYMQKMGITDTQYLLVRHLDQPHPHCHLVYNRVGNNGQTISDKNIKLRNAKVCRELTEKYGLYLASGKDDVRRERLREPDKTRYEIYDAIKGCLPKCKNWNELEGKLKEQGIGVRYKYCGNTDRKQGVLFSKNGFEFSGSKIDRAFSFTKLDNRFTHLQQQALHRAELLGNLSAAAGNYRSAFAGLFGNMGRGGGSAREEPLSVNLGKAGGIPLPPTGSPVGVSAEQLQRKPGESPEEHIARITALLNAAAEAMAIAAAEHRRRMEEQKRRAKIKL